MYSAGSDSRLTDQLTPTSALARSQDNVEGTRGESNTTMEREAVPRVTRIMEESLQDRGSLFPSQNLREVSGLAMAISF